jgi:hypothetical protein
MSALRRNWTLPELLSAIAALIRAVASLISTVWLP